MIQLTRINHSSLILNSDLIEHLQATPDTLVTLTNGHSYLVLDTPAEVVHKIVTFRRECLGCAALAPRQDSAHV
jgi:flagellar protein FlbD